VDAGPQFVHIQIQRGRSEVTPVTKVLRASADREEWLRNRTDNQARAEYAHWSQKCRAAGLKFLELEE